MDNDGNANIIHYASLKSKRVTRSVLAAELYAMVHGFDNGSILQVSLSEMFGRVLPLRLYTDSRSLLRECYTFEFDPREAPLIDLSLLREAFEPEKLPMSCGSPGVQNPADALTKSSPSPALLRLMKTNKLPLTPNAWVERPNPKWAQSG